MQSSDLFEKLGFYIFLLLFDRLDRRVDIRVEISKLYLS